MSPYSVVPTAPARVPADLLAAGWEAGRERGVYLMVRPYLARLAGRRASCPASLRLLREWVEVETADVVASYAARRSRPAPMTGPEAEEAPGDVRTCVACGSTFTRERKPGRPPTRCPSCRA